MKKKIIRLFYIVISSILALIIVASYHLYQFSKKRIYIAEGKQLFTLSQGTTPIQLAKQLEKENLIDDASLLPYLYKFNPVLSSIKAGTYELQSYMTIQYFLDLLVSGKENQFSVRFVEGKTAQDWLNILRNTPYIKHTLEGKTTQDLAELLGINGSVEGWLSPNTYLYTAGTSDMAILRRAYLTMKKELQEVWATRDPNLPYKTPYDLLIMASLIEKETNRDSERAKIASVFVNRLKGNMRLQTDPTIIYGLGKKYTGSIYKSHIADESNPYNTYRFYGLPPTPITMPSTESLKAAAQPDKTKYLYFVATGRGGHTFSTTYNQHRKAVNQYRKLVRNK